MYKHTNANTRNVCWNPASFIKGSLAHKYAYMQKTCDVAEEAILAKIKLQKKCVNRDKSA